jgi:hypothetical protein
LAKAIANLSRISILVPVIIEEVPGETQRAVRGYLKALGISTSQLVDLHMTSNIVICLCRKRYIKELTQILSRNRISCKKMLPQDPTWPKRLRGIMKNAQHRAATFEIGKAWKTLLMGDRLKET